MWVAKMNRSLVVLAAAVLLSACGAKQPVRDPAYAPVMPVETRNAQRDTGSIYRAGQGLLLFTDRKAYRVGDLLTVELQESTNASKSASTSASKEQGLDMAAPTLLGRSVTHNGTPILENSLDASRDFSGDAESSQSNQLSGSITVVVSDVLPNGNLRVRGEKVLSLNQGDEYIRLSGLVRPEDISPDNSVSSTKLADVHIIYGGDGVLADANHMGWAARFFNSVWPF